MDQHDELMQENSLIQNHYTKQPLDFLIHHGILGQKWGVRNGPPYPLGISDHSSSEKHAGWEQSLDKNGAETYNKGVSNKVNRQKDSIDKEKTKRIVRNVAIGAAVTAALLGTAYVVSKNRYDSKLIEYGNFTKNLTRLRLADKLSETPIEQLSDDDIVIKAGYSRFQRIIKGASVETALARERVKDVMYATYEQNDNDWYKNFVRLRENERNIGLKKIAMTMTNKNDLVMPSERKRIATFVEMLKNNPEFKKALSTDIQVGYGGNSFAEPDWLRGKLDDSKAQSYYTVFQTLLGDEYSKSRRLYFNRIVEMGYNAMIDDNDANRYSKTPLILLNASKDMVIKGGKTVSALDKFLSMMRVTEFDVEHWTGILERLK